MAAALNLPFSEVADLDWASTFLANVGAGLLASGDGSSGGASTGRPVAAPPRKEGGLSARDMATPGQLPGSARTANGAVRDGC